jgi:hypothetical protein
MGAGETAPPQELIVTTKDGTEFYVSVITNEDLAEEYRKAGLKIRPVAELRRAV